MLIERRTTRSRMKWNLTSTCLVREWNSGLIASRMALWLSVTIVVGLVWGMPILARRRRNQITFVAVA